MTTRLQPGDTAPDFTLPDDTGQEVSLSSLRGGKVISPASVKAMFTDPAHLRIEDPGQVDGNVVFTYLDAFDDDRAALEELKAQYRRGGVGDSKIKRRLDDILQALIGPIREPAAD